MTVVPANDPWLQLPLDGVHLIEASAGTGKTFTLATLVTRRVVERDLRLAQILAVTFTEAATQELRKRIRERLQLALDLADSTATEDDSSEASLTRALLDTHRARSGEPVDALCRRLRRAVDEIDLAAVFTIHSFCQRILREHALESGQGFNPPELLANDRELREEVATDLWRAHALDAASVDDLSALWKRGPVDLAADLPALVREPVLLPPLYSHTEAVLEAAQTRVASAQVSLQQAWLGEGEDHFDVLLAAVDADVMNRNSYKREWIQDLRDWLRAFAVNPQQNAVIHSKLDKLLTDALVAGTKKVHLGKTPTSPALSLAIVDYQQAVRALESALSQRRAALLHHLRDDARIRLARLKQRRRIQTYDDLIDGVSDALAGPRGDVLAQQLRAQYRVALVDEFQDTDLRQWQIFNRVFGMDSGEPALFLIGDPKQAIYGFRGGDVHTYLAARDHAEEAPALTHNFRSRPALLQAIDALYAQAGEQAFVDPRIRFQTLLAGGQRSDSDFQRNGHDAAALTLWCAPTPTPLDSKGKPKALDAPTSRALATTACVAAIHQLLSEARAGTATLVDKDARRPLRPGDLAVLVRNHGEASRIQRALADVGIPAVAAGKQSLFATPEARDLHTLLLALLHGADEARLRAALSTVLVGVDASDIEQLDANARLHRHWQYQALAWRERLQRGGPLALINDLCAAQAPRLLGLLDGERRMSNLLQLAEQLQEAQMRALGLQGLVDWLARRIANADPHDDTQLLRLQSDAHRVQIVTLHKSKGLEYPLVFLPFVGIGRQANSPGRFCVAHDEIHGRRLHWKLDLDEARWADAEKGWKQEQRAEDARLLYVGLTRAQHALWLATGTFSQFEKNSCALWPMLQDLPRLTAEAGIQLDRRVPPDSLARLPAESDAGVPAARVAHRHLSHDWWVYSFTQLAHAEAGTDPFAASTLPAIGGRDESAQHEDADEADTAFDPRFSGSRFGVALHAALEHAAFSRWRDWQAGDVAPDGEHAAIEAALRKEGYGVDELDAGIALTTSLIGHTLTAVLPERVRLCELAEGERRAEIEFQFSLQATRVDALLALLHAHGVIRERHGFGLRQRLEGLMTGLIDLTYRFDGRWYVLDYKSNRLPRYDAATLKAAMAHSEYDLQALIYTLALHRWLRFRLGRGYDYARDFGGIRYLFCRGLDAGRTEATGIHAQCFSAELVHALDALFGYDASQGAAA